MVSNQDALQFPMGFIAILQELGDGHLCNTELWFNGCSNGLDMICICTETKALMSWGNLIKKHQNPLNGNRTVTSRRKGLMEINGIGKWGTGTIRLNFMGGFPKIAL